MRSACVFFLSCFLAASAAAQSVVTGVVRDESGAVVSSATVVVRAAGGAERQVLTGPDGRFSVESGPGPSTVIVRAGGFAEVAQPASGSGPMEIVLKAASVLESVTVTPTRTEQRLGDVPASVSVVDRQTIEHSPAVVADDVLRLVPTFSLFRRTSSLSANPTAQGVSLRGIGPSGVSRTLVLMDGVPFNDPFGGWVYWTRIPLDSVDRVEVVDGSSSNVYGNYAMGGVINIVSARPRPRSVAASTQYGNRNSPKADFFASDVWKRVGVSLDGSFFDTDGFPIVLGSERGPIDTKSTVTFKNVNGKVDFSPTSRISAFVRGGYFREERNNAKSTTFDPATGARIPATAGQPEANDTLWKSVNGGIRATLPDQSSLQATVFADWDTFNSNFLAVPDTVKRDTARVSLVQHVPTTNWGSAALWSKPVATKQLYSAGFDVRHVDGASHERTYDTATGTTQLLDRESGGTQTSSGAFIQGQFFPVTQFSFTLSGRVDHWRNYNGRNRETTLATGLPTANDRTLPDSDDTVFSPRVAAMYHVSDRVSAWGSLGAGFRAPTLNELYRQFRVGALLTLANDQLKPEHLLGGELGVNVAALDNLSVRTTWFDNRMKDPVANVTLPSPANTQQRMNLGRTRIWGVQTDVEYRLGTTWRVGGGYVFNQAKVVEFTPLVEAPSIVGNYLPQVPVHRGSANVVFSDPRVATVSVSALFFGRQFDDDQNQRAKPGSTEPGLPGYATLELSVSRSLVRGVDVFFGAQNLFNTEYYVGYAPTTLGSPRLVNGGVRVRFAGR